MSSTKRANSPATSAVPVSTYNVVRWSGSTERSRSTNATSCTYSSLRPRRCSTVTDASGGSTSSSASFTSDSTSRVSHWPMRRRPTIPAASTAKRWPSTMRPPAHGSTPSLDHARSANDSPGMTDNRISPRRAASWSRVTVRSATAGLPGYRVRNGASLVHRRHQRRDDRRVDLLEVGCLLVAGVEALEIEAVAGELGDGRVTGRAHEAPVGPHDRSPCRGEHEVGAGGSEADDHDLAGGHPAGCGVVGVVGSSGSGSRCRPVVR